MRDIRKTEIRVGIFSVLGLLLLIWIIGWAKNVSVASDKKILNIKFDSVAGLEVQDVVTVNGVRVGHVVNIQFNNGSVLVETNIEQEADLREDAEFSVMMLDLMGGKKIEIQPGKSSVKLNYEKVQTGYFAGDVGTTIATLNSVQQDLIAIIKDMKISLDNLNVLIGDENFNNQIKEAVANMNNAVVTLTDLVQKNKDEFSLLLKSGTELTQSAGDLIKQNKENIEELLKNINLTVSSSNDLLNKLNQFAGETKEQKNALGKTLYDEKLYNDLKEMINKANEMISLLLEQLKSDGVKVDANIF